jgi:hypothetical protein
MGADDPVRPQETARRGFLAPPDPCIPPPRIATEPFEGPSITIADVYSWAGVPYRYSGGHPPRVAVGKGGRHARAVDPDGARILVVDEEMIVESPTEALRWLRVLEVLGTDSTSTQRASRRAGCSAMRRPKRRMRDRRDRHPENAACELRNSGRAAIISAAVAARR